MHYLGHSRIRPGRSYYLRLGLPLPWPEDNQGMDAAGLELDMTVVEGIVTCSGVQHPCVLLEFVIWGEYEHHAFASMLNDHRRLIKLLLAGSGFELFTAGFFENLESKPGYSLMRKLDLYLQNEDDEHCFHLQKIFTTQTGGADFYQSYARLLVLFDACMGYAQKRKEKDRLLSHFLEFPHWRFPDPSKHD